MLEKRSAPSSLRGASTGNKLTCPPQGGCGKVELTLFLIVCGGRDARLGWHLESQLQALRGEHFARGRIFPRATVGDGTPVNISARGACDPHGRQKRGGLVLGPPSGRGRPAPKLLLRPSTRGGEINSGSMSVRAHSIIVLHAYPWDTQSTSASMLRTERYRANTRRRSHWTGISHP